MINLKKIFILLFCVVLLSVTFCSCGNNDEELRKVNNNSTNVSTEVKISSSNRNLKADTSTTTTSISTVKENTTEFSTISKENVEKEIEKVTTKSNNFKSKNKNKPTNNQEKSTLAFFDED